MKKLLVIFSFMLVLASCSCQKQDTALQNINKGPDPNINFAKQQVANYRNYNASQDEFNKLAKSEENYIFYYAADNKRYVFPSEKIYKTWFENYPIEDIKTYNLETLYKTEFNGNVDLRPGTLLQTPTDPKTYIAIKNGEIKAFADNALLIDLYGENWQSNVVEIENKYFTQYERTQPIENLADFPKVFESYTIDKDKNLK